MRGVEMKVMRGLYIKKITRMIYFLFVSGVEILVLYTKPDSCLEWKYRCLGQKRLENYE